MNSADVQQAVQEEVSSRLSKATAELQQKYATGKGGDDAAADVDGPTGAAYREKEAAERKVKNERKARNQTANENRGATEHTTKAGGDGSDDDSEGEDEDYELRQIRERRLRQIKSSQREKIENLGKGHGQFREIVQDEFLAEACSSLRVICLFYHNDFPRCEIMSHHLAKLAPRHIETKFVKINADKALFFVDKLKIRSLPTVVIFNDGVAQDKIVGFEGVADDQPEGKEDEWPTIKLARALAAKRGIDSAVIVDDDGIEEAAKAKLDNMRKNIFSFDADLDMDELDLDS